MLTVTVTERWLQTFPGAHIGLLQVGPVDNTRRPTPLDDFKPELESSLRQLYGKLDRPALLALEVLQAYKHYYRAFNKTYHVQLQLESVLQGKSLPRVNPLVDACFAAELESHLLTASHDLDAMQPPVVMDASDGSEILPMMNGKHKQVKPGDMLMRDAVAPVCTIIYGQDRRTSVTPATRNVLYVTYAPSGIRLSSIAAHHALIVRNIHRFAPAATILDERIVAAD